MTRWELEQARAYAFPCSLCGAAPGAPCAGRTTVRAIHAARQRVATQHPRPPRGSRPGVPVGAPRVGSRSLRG